MDQDFPTAPIVSKPLFFYLLGLLGFPFFGFGCSLKGQVGESLSGNRQNKKNNRILQKQAAALYRSMDKEIISKVHVFWFYCLPKRFDFVADAPPLLSVVFWGSLEIWGDQIVDP